MIILHLEKDRFDNAVVSCVMEETEAESLSYAEYSMNLQYYTTIVPMGTL